MFTKISSDELEFESSIESGGTSVYSLEIDEESSAAILDCDRDVNEVALGLGPGNMVSCVDDPVTMKNIQGYIYRSIKNTKREKRNFAVDSTDQLRLKNGR